MKHGFFGIGNSNIGVYDYLSRQGELGEVTLRSDDQISYDAAARLGATRVFSLGESLADIDEDILFLSPSVRREREQLILAKKRGTRLSSDLELFLERRGKLDYAITGSDGKSTTTYIIAAALAASGIKTRPTGNFGTPLSSVIDSDDAVVAELSSFQLNYTAPEVGTAIITGITPNHLNWHSSLDEYIAAKRAITQKADRVILDADSELMESLLTSRRIHAVASTSLQFNELSKHVKSEHYLTYRCGTIYLDSSPLVDISEAMRKETYNVKNYMLAIGALADSVSPKALGEVICSFSGLAHRAEFIAEKGGVKYYDSSVDSTPERALATLRGMRGRTVAIIAGRGKKLSLFRLAEELPSLTVGCVLMGEIGRELSVLLSKIPGGYNHLFADDMDGALIAARHLLGGDGNVVLSPAGTSFDVYKNFEERGRAFCQAVLNTK